MSPPFPAGCLEVKSTLDVVPFLLNPGVEGTLDSVDKFILLDQKLKVIHKEQGVA